MINTALISLILMACTQTSPADTDNSGENGADNRTDIEMFNSLILKSDIEALPAKAYLVDAENTQFETVLTFSNVRRCTLESIIVLSLRRMRMTS